MPVEYSSPGATWTFSTDNTYTWEGSVTISAPNWGTFNYTPKWAPEEVAPSPAVKETVPLFPESMQWKNGTNLGHYCVKYGLTKLPSGYAALNEEGRDAFSKVVMGYFHKGIAHPAKAGPWFASARRVLAMIEELAQTAA